MKNSKPNTSTCSDFNENCYCFTGKKAAKCFMGLTQGSRASNITTAGLADGSCPIIHKPS